eukprot:SAG11_NODE_24_length_24699_cov_10.132195_11_plen_627_part_00
MEEGNGAESAANAIDTAGQPRRSLRVRIASMREMRRVIQLQSRQEPPKARVQQTSAGAMQTGTVATVGGGVSNSLVPPAQQQDLEGRVATACAAVGAGISELSPAPARGCGSRLALREHFEAAEAEALAAEERLAEAEAEARAAEAAHAASVRATRAVRAVGTVVAAGALPTSARRTTSADERAENILPRTQSEAAGLMTTAAPCRTASAFAAPLPPILRRTGARAVLPPRRAKQAPPVLGLPTASQGGKAAQDVTTSADHLQPEYARLKSTIAGTRKPIAILEAEQTDQPSSPPPSPSPHNDCRGAVVCAHGNRRSTLLLQLLCIMAVALLLFLSWEAGGIVWFIYCVTALWRVVIYGSKAFWSQLAPLLDMLAAQPELSSALRSVEATVAALLTLGERGGPMLLPLLVFAAGGAVIGRWALQRFSLCLVRQLAPPSAAAPSVGAAAADRCWLAREGASTGAMAESGGTRYGESIDFSLVLTTRGVLRVPPRVMAPLLRCCCARVSRSEAEEGELQELASNLRLSLRTTAVEATALGNDSGGGDELSPPLAVMRGLLVQLLSEPMCWLCGRPPPERFRVVFGGARMKCSGAFPQFSRNICFSPFLFYFVSKCVTHLTPKLPLYYQ